METRRFIKVASVVLISAFFVPSIVFAYSVETHSALTKNTFEQYLKLNGERFSENDISNALKGSVDEDSSLRFINHFYDPINDQGLRRSLRDGNPSNGLSSVLWAEDILIQGEFAWGTIRKHDKLFSSETDFSWDRAVYEYVYGDKAHALQALGHQLHLVQDATVPAHVRNDAHPPWNGGDSYESFTSTRNLTMPDSIFELKDAYNIEEIITTAAYFTNINFLSRDAGFDEYGSPAIEDLYFEDGFGVHKRLGHRVARAKQTYDRKLKTEILEYFFDDQTNEISKSYWITLSKQAVTYGVATIDIFLRDVEIEKKSGELLAMNKSRSEVKKFANTLADIRDSKFKITSLAAADIYELNKDDLDGYFAAAAVYGVHVPVIARDSPLKDEAPQQQLRESIVGVRIVTIDPSYVPKKEVPQVEEKKQLEEKLVDSPTEQKVEKEVIVEVIPKEDSEVFIPKIPLVLPVGFIGGGGPPPEVVDVVPVAPILTTALLHATTSLVFEGTGISGYLLTSIIGTSTATTSIDTSGSWIFATTTIQEGIVTTSFTQTDADGIESEPITQDIVIDITPPNAVTLDILECVYTLRSDGECLSGTPGVHLQWSTSSDATYYGVFVSGIEIATTTSTDMAIVLNDQETSAVAVSAYDEAGNTRVSNIESVAVFEHPIVVSEIAWAGTGASSEDEWFELYNKSGHKLTLDSVRLRASDESTLVMLSGTIGTGEFWNERSMIIERGSDTVTSRTAELVTDWDLFLDTGAELILELATGTLVSVLDRTPVVSDCGGWCGGDLTDRRPSMERKDVSALGSLSSNWHTKDNYAVTNEYYDARGYIEPGFNLIAGSLAQPSSYPWPSFGYFCGEPGSPLAVDGEDYTPAGTQCTFLSDFISPSGWVGGIKRYGTLYRGTVGSSTGVYGHFLGRSKKKIEYEDIAGLNPAEGENFFVVIGEEKTFISGGDYFTIGSSTIPEGTWQMLKWKYRK